tara:strand:- start:403 stop:1014 length:612 start_codon:yes stop_codon:yes gene_type:complete
MVKKKKSIALRLRNYFFTGVIVLVPIGFTLYLSKFLINFSTKLVPAGLNPNTYLPIAIPGIEIVLTIIFITIVGSLSLSFLGKKFLQIVDDLFKRIPILRTIYSAIGQMTDSFRSQEGNKKSVVLLQYPRHGSWAVGFATRENVGEIKSKTQKELVNVFVPTTPNPTSGFLLMIPKTDLIYLDMTFEEASKFIVSAGTSNPNN